MKKGADKHEEALIVVNHLSIFDSLVRLLVLSLCWQSFNSHSYVIFLFRSLLMSDRTTQMHPLFISKKMTVKALLCVQII